MIGGSRIYARVLVMCVVAFSVASVVGRTAKTVHRAVSRGQLERVLPERIDAEDFVSSDTCQACHPDQYASWHASFHRTMTQIAARDAVVGDFDNVRLEHAGRSYHLQRRGDEFWVTEGGREQRIAMTTGSHHMQAYWTPAAGDRTLVSFPFVYLFEDRRWVPRDDAFLLPPRMSDTPRIWNATCAQCHSTHDTLTFNVDTGRVDVPVAELGIACEACHGPAAEHVRANHDPERRYRLHFDAQPDPTIVNPRQCTPRVASRICGDCHSIFRFALRTGATPGQKRITARHPRNAARPLEAFTENPQNYFWADGMVRVSGREYNGLIESPCYQRGDLSCLSCHSMHESDPDDQIIAGMRDDEACLQCHATHRAAIEKHTHHPEHSTGSRCYNCHMPHTTYGLLKAIRSHQIDSPTVAVSVEFGRPNACNLCHLDRTLGWAAEHLTDWYGLPSERLNDEERSISAALLWTLKGDAGQRALAAWHMGWEPALQASGRHWLAPFLARLLDDPYAAVRYLAYRSLRALPGYRDFSYDYIAPLQVRAQARKRVMDLWSGPRASPRERVTAQVLFSPDGSLRSADIDHLLVDRDDRPVDLME